MSKYGRFIMYCIMVVLFATGLVTVYLAARVSSLFFSSRRHRILVQRIIHLGARLFFWFVGVFGLMSLRLPSGRVGVTGLQPGVVVANHPSMLDALLLLALCPNAVCVMKRSLRRIPVLGGLASMAGYVSSSEPEEFLKESSARISEGSHVLIFPEGTRSNGSEVGPFKRGAAWIVSNLGCPLLVFVIRMSPVYLGKGGGLLEQVSFPIAYSIDFVGSSEGRVVAEEALREAVLKVTQWLEESIKDSLCSSTLETASTL